jgi:hypothetical protein
MKKNVLLTGPRSSVNSVGHRLCYNSIPSSELSNAGSVRKVQSPAYRNYLDVELCGVMTFAGFASSLVDHINRIVFARTKKKMVWIDATPVVTFVQHKQAIQNFPVVDFPANSVRTKWASAAFSRADLPIPGAVCRTHPVPALRCGSDGYKGPESFLNRNTGRSLSCTFPRAEFTDCLPVPHRFAYSYLKTFFANLARPINATLARFDCTFIRAVFSRSVFNARVKNNESSVANVALAFCSFCPCSHAMLLLVLGCTGLYAYQIKIATEGIIQ